MGILGHCLERYNFEDPTNCQYTWRLARVSNSFGYSVAFTYAGHGQPGRRPAALDLLSP